MKLDRKQIIRFFLLLWAIPILVLSCQPKKSPIEFPSDKTEFEEPKISPLEFGDPKEVEWNVTDMKAFPAPISRNVNLQDLAAKPFYPEGYFPLKTPMIEIDVAFNPLLDSSIIFSEIPSLEINFETSLLDKPKKIKAGLPKIDKNSSLGILEFSEDQGLPSYLVTALKEDSHGAMWIATDKGLSRFDGEYLENFNFIESFFTGSQAIVNDILEDKRGRIWIYTSQKGLYTLDIRRGLVNSFDFSAIDQSFNFNDNCSMVMDEEGSIWVGTLRDGLFIIDPENDTYRHIPQLGPTAIQDASKLTIDKDGNIWVGSSLGLTKIDPRNGSVQTIENQKDVIIAPVNALFTDSNNQIWVGSSSESVSVFNTSRTKVNILGNDQGIETSIAHFSEGFDQKIWMSSNEGLYSFDPNQRRLKHINASDGLIDDFINTTLFDSEGQIWIATQDGINLFPLKGLAPIFLKASDGLTGPDAWSFFEDSNGRLWIGTRQGLDIYDPEKNSIKRIDQALQMRKANNISHKTQRLSPSELLISSPGLGYCIYDEINQTIKYITSNQGLTNIFPSSTIVDSKGRIWSGSFRDGSIEVIDLKNNQVKGLTNKEGIFGSIVWGFIEDPYGQIWAGTDLGINIINTENNTISLLLEYGKPSQRNSGAFFKDEEERLWIGTRSGLLIADQENNQLTEISVQEGLINPAVYTAYSSNGINYIGTGNGLTILTPKPEGNEQNKLEFDLKSFDKGQGLIYTDFNADAAFEFNDKLWWGIETEAITLTNLPQKNPSESQARISGITISDKPQVFFDREDLSSSYPKLDTLFSAKKDTFFLANNIPDESNWLSENEIKWDGLTGYFNLPAQLEIPFEHNYLSFQFNSTQLSDRDKVRYRYFLEGFDKEWSQISSDPFSENYRNLPAGDYTFHVRSLSFDGRWSEPDRFSFTILPHWTNTWWAWVLYLIGFSTLVGTIVQYRAKALKKENLILEEKVKHRTAQLNQSLENLKSTQAQLIQSEKMASLGELTAGIAHEIQNPLNFVNNFSELNKELLEEANEELEKGDIEETKVILKDLGENSEKINYHGKRADAIVKGMLEHSRSNKGDKALTDLNALADEFVRLSYHGLRAKDKEFNADFKLDLDPDLPKVNVVASDIGRVILNLVNNAFYACAERSRSTVNEKVKSTPEGYNPKVVICSKQTEKGIELSVKDNGNGVPEHIKEKIFQPFFTTKPTGSGTGLGLSLSYDIVKAHGGELRVESEEGEGTTFIISLPFKFNPI
ncbi:two-component regulator propeller domain-containing protein [Algoriphagus namhaensis]|uniref:histidine kinase n=1 Tax=Algoriphagus namhaensis TaxID=915353 RepID=A0ABV8APC3_9BACT